MSVVLWIIGFLLCSWLVLSGFICAYWFFRPNEWFWDNHKYVTIAIGIGAFLSCMGVVSIGVEKLFWFIPENWVFENEEGELHIVRFSLAGFIGFAAACFLGFLFEKVQQMRRSIGELEIEAKFAQKRANRKAELVDICLLDNFKTSELQEIASELRGWLDELKQKGKSNDDSKIEWAALINLWAAVEENIDNRKELDST